MKRSVFAAAVLVTHAGASVAGTTTAPDVHYVYAVVTDGFTSKGNDDNGAIVGDYTDLATSDTVADRGPNPFNGGGRVTASVSLATGTIRLNTVALPATEVAGYGGGASAQAGIGARIFLFGPANVAGKVQITTHVIGTFSDPDTYGDGGPGAYGSSVAIYVEAAATTLAFGGGLGFVGSLSDMIYTATDGTTVQLTCNRCRTPTGAPVPTEVTTTIPFQPGQGYVDFAADLIADAEGAATVSERAVSVSIKLPPGFTYTSSMKFSSQ